MTKADADFVRATVVNGETGQATLTELARAHDICTRAGATKTLGVLRQQIRRMTPGPQVTGFVRTVIAGVIAGTIVTFTFGRHR